MKNTPAKPKVNATLICSAGCSHKLIWTTDHPASHYGLGVLRIARTNRIIDGASVLADPGLRIITNDPLRVCNALAIPDCPQVMKD